VTQTQGVAALALGWALTALQADWSVSALDQLWPIRLGGGAFFGRLSLAASHR
jgi:hypothetical protein